MSYHFHSGAGRMKFSVLRVDRVRPAAANGANPKRENTCVAAAMWGGAVSLEQGLTTQVDPERTS